MTPSRASHAADIFRRSALALALACALQPACAANASSGASNLETGLDANYDPFAALDVPADANGETAPAYRDRIIAADRLQKLPADEDEEDTLSGPPRAMHVELIAHDTRFNGESSVELGAAFGGFWETDDYGTLSAEALLFRSDRERDGRDRWRGTATLWQRGLRMPGGWSANNGIGVLNTPLPGLLREQYKFFLPSVPMIGISSEWQQRDRRQSWQAAIGRGGNFGGTRLSGFEIGDGSVATLGGQWAWSNAWTGAFSLLATDGRIVPDSQGLPAFQNQRTSAVVFGNRWDGARDAVSLNLQTSDSGGENAWGFWADARSDRGRFTHRYGAFHLEPGLAWGAWPINNDVRGGYYRVDYNRARWSLNAGIDRIDSISGEGFDGWFGNAYARYQASSRLGYGGGVSARDNRNDSGHDRAQSLQLFVDTRSNLGQTRLQYDRSHDSRTTGSWQVLVDHALRMREGARLSVSAGYGELAYDRTQGNRTLTFATYGGFDLTDDFSIDGTIRWSRSSGADDSHGLDLNLGWCWRLSARWTLLGNASENRSARRSPFALDPLTSQPVAETPVDRSVFISLRYDFSAGRPRPVLGGPPSAATGNIGGSVFLDENGDGVRSASEAAAANVTLLLDGRYTARTDDLGRFRFDRVAVGEHELTVVADNLPLPWFIDEDRMSRTVSVEVRGDTDIAIGAQRQR